MEGGGRTMNHARQAVRPFAVAWVLLACLVAPFARADEQSDRIQALEKRLEESARAQAENAKLIQALAARVAELERAAKATPEASAKAASAPGTAAPATAASPSATDHGPAIAELQQSVAQISEGLSKRSSNGETGLPMHGFADVQAAWSTKRDPNRLRGFNAGTLDLYLTPQFGERVRSLIEVAVEYEPTGEGVIDMERLQVGYIASDSLTMWLGRFHTPFGLWNTAFHHGANLQTSISRPRFIDFEDKGGIIPAHSVGVWGSGKHALGDGKITYDAYLSNGPSIRHAELDFNPFTDDDGGKMVGGNIGYQPHGELSGLSVGVHGFTSVVNAFTEGGTSIGRSRLRMAGGYLGYDERDWEVFAEFYRFANTNLADGIRRPSKAWFVHAGRTYGNLTPYLRFERASLDPGDLFFVAQDVGRSYDRTVLGARYALDARSSLKLEWSRTSEPAMTQIDGNGLLVPFLGGTYRRLGLQYSIAF